MNIGIISTRDFDNYGRLEEVLDGYALLQPITRLVASNRSVLGRLVREYALSRNIPAHILEARWDRLGDREADLWNMHTIAECDEIIAFGDTTPELDQALDIISTRYGKEATVICS